MMRSRAALRRLRRFRRDEGGSVTVEAVITFPLLAWAVMATQVFFQGFHVQSLNVKVTYTIGDILSREDMPITPEYLDSMYAVQAAMTGSADPGALRVTAITYRAAQETYRVVWSEVRGAAQPHSDSTIKAIAEERLPDLTDGQVIILTETWLQHRPEFLNWVGIGPLIFHEVTVTLPRAPQFCWNPQNDQRQWNGTSTRCNV